MLECREPWNGLEVGNGPVENGLPIAAEFGSTRKMTIHEKIHPRDVAACWFERVWNLKDPSAIHELMDPSAEARSEAGVVRGPEQFEQLVFKSMLTAFPNIHVQVQGIISEGDECVVRWKATGVQSGSLAGIPPSGKSVMFSGMTWLRVCQGKLMEGEDRYNLHAVMQYIAGGQPSTTVNAPETT